METIEGAKIDSQRASDSRSASSYTRRVRSERDYSAEVRSAKAESVATDRGGQVKSKYRDPVELHSKQKIEEARQSAPDSFQTELFGSSWNSDTTAYDYELSEFNDLIVKVVVREDRAEVVRQYPTKGQMNYKNAFRRFIELIGL
jgi:hypothetical protein